MVQCLLRTLVFALSLQVHSHPALVGLSAHRLSTIRGSDVIHLVEKGRIIASGSYDELLETSPEFSRMARTTPHLKEQEPSDQVLPLPEVGSTTR